MDREDELTLEDESELRQWIWETIKQDRDTGRSVPW